MIKQTISNAATNIQLATISSDSANKYMTSMMAWGLGGIGAMVALYGLFEFFQGGTSQDSSRKTAGMWTMGAGLVLIAIGGVVAIFFGNPPKAPTA